MNTGCVVGKPQVMARIRSVGITSGFAVIQPQSTLRGLARTGLRP
jgi:hypothetical protein